MSPLKKPRTSAPLTITFHNPNQGDDFVKALIKVAAEMAKTSVSQTILHTKVDPVCEE